MEAAGAVQRAVSKNGQWSVTQLMLGYRVSCSTNDCIKIKYVYYSYVG
jgi:hypothetical protein